MEPVRGGGCNHGRDGTLCIAFGDERSGRDGAAQFPDGRGIIGGSVAAFRGE
jgi:hypothetical protein